MCGILIRKNEFNPRFDIFHRGIDGSSVVYDGYTFHHRTLPIQSSSLDRQDYIQPILINNRYLLLYNGEIFNFRKFGIYTSDLHYLRNFFGAGFKEKLLPEINQWDGFWAICLYDTLDGILTCFTDPLGKKQLYYSKDGICSECKPILTEDHDKLYYSENNFGTITTPFWQVYRLLPNRVYKMNIKLEENMPSCFIKEYFKLRTGSIKEDFYNMMDESVKARMINKIDGVTLFVSGGLDSTIILHHMIERGATMELLSIENQLDAPFVKILQKRYGLQIRTIDANDRDKEKMVFLYESPIDYGSLIPQYCLCQATANTVIFTGDGADELFGGYARAANEDTQSYDVFEELPYYHHIRLDRMSMAFTKEIRQPFLSTDIIRYALSLPRHTEVVNGKTVLHSLRVGKKILYDTYKKCIPKEILERKKTPLRFKGIKENNINKIFYESPRTGTTFRSIGNTDEKDTVGKGSRLQQRRRSPGKL